MAKVSHAPPRTLRLVLSDGTLDVTLSEGTLSYLLAGVVAAWRDRLDAERFGGLVVSAHEGKPPSIRFERLHTTTLFSAD